MLFKETVEPHTLGLLRELISIPALSKFALVGGTNLSLRFGHRLSVDLDLFTNEDFDSDAVIEAVKTKYESLEIYRKTKNSFSGQIEGVKLDIMAHQYAYIQPIEEIEGIRFLSVPDVVAMKLNAMANRGAKKDFYDLVKLFDIYSLQEMLKFFQIKYRNNEIGFIIHSIYYFDDAENQTDPISLDGQTWEKVKQKIVELANDFINKNI